MQLQYKYINTEFKYPFTISNGRTKTHQPALVVALTLGRFTGYGEAPAITYYNITVEQMIADLQAKKPFVEKFALTEPERYWHYLHHLFPKNPFLVCALDMACWDLFGKMKNQPLYKLWDTEFLYNDEMENNIPLCDYTIGIDSIEKMQQKIIENPWPIYKIKLGSEQDIEVIQSLRTISDKPFRIDVNGGWTLNEALEKIEKLQDLGIEMIEQPLEKSNWDGMKILYEQSPIPLFADESCVFENDVEKCVNHFHGINIKLTKCSGITPALRMIQRARSLNLKVMMGSMNETEIGSAAIANFLPKLDMADLDGPLLLKTNAIDGLDIQHGKVRLSGQPGLGLNGINILD